MDNVSAEKDGTTFFLNVINVLMEQIGMGNIVLVLCQQQIGV